jgi:hypothetical protein
LAWAGLGAHAWQFLPAGLVFGLLPDGPVRAMEITTIVAAGLLVGALVLVRLLPKGRAWIRRTESEGHSHGWPDCREARPTG